MQQQQRSENNLIIKRIFALRRDQEFQEEEIDSLIFRRTFHLEESAGSLAEVSFQAFPNTDPSGYEVLVSLNEISNVSNNPDDFHLPRRPLKTLIERARMELDETRDQTFIHRLSKAVTIEPNYWMEISIKSQGPAVAEIKDESMISSPEPEYQDVESRVLHPLHQVGLHFQQKLSAAFRLVLSSQEADLMGFYEGLDLDLDDPVVASVAAAAAALAISPTVGGGSNKGLTGGPSVTGAPYCSAFTTEETSWGRSPLYNNGIEWG